MDYNSLMGAVNNLYDVNDRLGVELMGAGRWNGLKKVVTRMSANAIQNANNAPLMGFSLSSVGKGITSMGKGITKGVSRAARSISGAPSKVTRRVSYGAKRSFMHGDYDALCAELWGFNDDYGEELLGGLLTDLKNNVANVTHKILDVGSKIPVADAAVERFRDITGVITGAKTATDVATVAYDNRGKIILGGVALAIVIYLLTRDKKKR